LVNICHRLTDIGCFSEFVLFFKTSRCIIFYFYTNFSCRIQ